MHIVLRGFWSPAVMADYTVELRRRAGSLRDHGGCRRILVDMTDYPIQSQEIAQAHSRIIQHGKIEMKAATAVVMTSVLSRLQAKRMANIAGNELFDDEPAARAWLLAQPIID